MRDHVEMPYGEMIKPKSFITNSRLILFYSVPHTASNFVRTAFEMHESVDLVVNEAMHDEEGRTIQDAMIESLAGIGGKVAFYHHFLRVREQNQKNLAYRYEQHKEGGYKLARKDVNTVKLFALFAHANYAVVNDMFAYPFYAFITPVRHPLLAMISMMRRLDGGEENLHKRMVEWIRCAKIIWHKKFPLYVFVNPWENPTGILSGMKKLGLKPNPETYGWLNEPPVVNKTHSPGEERPDHIYGESHCNNDQELIDARNHFLDTGEALDCIKDVSKLLESSGVMNRYRMLCDKHEVQAAPSRFSGV